MFNQLHGLVLALCMTAGACEGEQRAGPPEPQPLVGVLELPVSLRSSSTRPVAAVVIEMGPGELRLDGRSVVAFDAGRVPTAERYANTIAKLAGALARGPARRRAAVRVHVNTPYETTVLMLRTLEGANIHEVAFEVRRPGTTSSATGWLVIEGFRVVEPSEDAVAAEASALPAWGDFVASWIESYDACRAGPYVDCDPVPTVVAEGGSVKVLLRARGSAVKVEFTRVGGPPAVPTHPPRQAVGGAAEEFEPVPPMTEAVFSFRAEATTTERSAVSGVARPLCGARQCATVIVADPDTPTMRPLSLFGAAFPNGTRQPSVVFQLPL